MPEATLNEARAAKGHVEEICRGLEQVVGVGITRIGNSYAVQVNLSSAPDGDQKLPETVDGVPVRVRVVGTLRKE